MTYSDKREFAARVFAAVLVWDVNPEWIPGRIAALLAQAQLDALPDGSQAQYATHVHVKNGDLALMYRCDIDAAYALAVQLAPLVGVDAVE